jgi:uncharacterized protein
MKLSLDEKNDFINHTLDLFRSKQVHDMRLYIQHGNITTLNHCISVAYYSYLLSLRLPWHYDSKSIARGAMLHDFYLYDWHTPDKSHKLHGFTHSTSALNNANKFFLLNETESEIIRSHMWPLNLTKRRKNREARLVCTIDKIISLAET